MAKRFLKTAVVSALFALTLAVSASAASAGGATTTTAVNFRTGAGTNYGIISTLPAGTHVVVSSQSSGGWATVVYNGTVGYISSDYLKRANDMDASFGTGTIDGSYVRMRSGASTSSSSLGTYNSGTTMTVTGVSGAWYKVDYNGNTGYMSSDYIAIDQDNLFTTYGRVPEGTVHVRADASTDSASLATISTGTIVTVNGLVNGWYDVTCQYGTEGYIRSDLLVLTSNPTSSKGSSIVETAMKHLGTRYVYGGASAGGFDCSGFTMYIYKQFGYNLPHSATSQWLSGMGAKIYSISELQPGDLVFFNDPSRNAGKACSHAGIYIGNGQFIHSSSGAGCVVISDLSSSYYLKNYVGAKRIAG